jgi:2-phospho-L-lactate guanylyltransferase (CobY/MobA/RfbA family)
VQGPSADQDEAQDLLEQELHDDHKGQRILCIWRFHVSVHPSSIGRPI